MRFALALLLIGCSATKPPTPEELFPRSSRRIARVPRPEIDVQPIEDVAEIDRADLISPLSHEPGLEPSVPIARLYGVETWRSLCEARRNPKGVDADEAVGYLIAWCELRSDRMARARQQLAGLANARSPAIALGVREDIVDLLAFDGELPAAQALEWLRHASLEDPRLLDALTAAYVAMNRDADARVVGKAQARGIAWVNGLDCRSLFRLWWLLEEPWIRDGIQMRRDPTCKRMAAAMERIDIARNCPLLGGRDGLHDDPCTELGCGALDRVLATCGAAGATEAARLALAHRHWPSLEGRPWVWLAYARYVGSGSDAARTVASAALENAALTSDCREILPAIHEVARTLGDGPAQRYLRELDEEHCVKRHSPTLDRR